MFIIHDSTPIDVAVPVIDGQRVATGCIARDYAVQPPKVEAVTFPTFSKQELLDRIRERKKQGAGLQRIRRTFLAGKPIPSLDQGQWGYCWSHSSTMALMLERAKANLPYVPLSAFMPAALIKGGANEGGWAALSMEFLQKYGTCSQSLWPQKDASLSRNTTETTADAAKHKVSEAWVDLEAAVYDRNLTLQQMLSLVVCDIPVAADFYWWGHSVCVLDAVEVDGEPCPLIINSWTDGWGDLGEAVLQGTRAVPNGAVACRASVAA